MQKKNIVLLFFIIKGLFWTALIASFFMVDKEKINTTFIHYFQDNFGKEGAKFANISIKYLPKPYIVVDKIEVPEVLSMKDVTFSFSVLSVIKFNPEINAINAKEVEFYLKMPKKTFPGLDPKAIFALPNLSLSAKKLSFIDEEVINLYNAKFIHENDRVNLQGKFQTLALKYEANKKGEDFEINYKLEGDLLKLTLNMFANSGTLSLHSNDIAKTISSYLQKCDMISGFLAYKQPLDLASKIKIKEGEIELSDITIKSGKTSGAGRILIPASLPSEVKIVFDTFQVDEIFAKNDYVPLNNYTITFDSDMNIDIAIGALKYAKKEAMKDVSISASILKGGLNINSLSGNLSNLGQMSLNGKITSNKYRSLFEGMVIVDVSNLNTFINEYNLSGIINLDNKFAERNNHFRLQSPFNATLKEFSLSDAEVILGNIGIRGNLFTRMIGVTPRVHTKLVFDSLNLDDTYHPAVNQLISYIRSLTENLKDADYVRKLQPIRNIPIKGEAQLYFKNLQHHDSKFQNVKSKIFFSPGNIHISDFVYMQNNNFLNLGFGIKLNELKPQFSLKLLSKYLDMNFLSPEVFFSFRRVLLDAIDFNKMNFLVDIAVDEITFADSLFKGLQIALETQDNIVQFKTLNLKLEEMLMQSAGNISIEPLDLNFKYAFQNLDLLKLTGSFTKKYYTFPGNMTLTGTISSHGGDVASIIANSNGQGSFIASNVILKNMNIDAVISAILNKELTKDNIDKNKVIDYLASAETVFTNIGGKLSLANKTLYFSDINFSTNYAVGKGGGELALPTFDARFISELAFKPYFDGTFHNSVIVNMKVDYDGNLNALRISPDIDGLVKFLSMRGAPR